MWSSAEWVKADSFLINHSHASCFLIGRVKFNVKQQQQQQQQQKQT